MWSYLDNNDIVYAVSMKRISLYIILLCLAACGSHKSTPVADSRFKRKPMVEVTETQLKEEAALVDALVQQMVGNDEQALSRYQAIIARQPSMAVAHYEAGRLLLAQGHPDSALAYTLRACRMDEGNVWYRLQLAGIYDYLQDGKNLIATWETIVRMHPDVVEYYYELSNAYLTANDVVGSIKVLDRVEARWGVSEEVSVQKQKLWAAVNRPDKAREELERLANALPHDTRYQAILAQTYVAEKRYDRALQCYRNILDAAPDEETAHVGMAECYLAMGNYGDTYRHLRQGLQHPDIDCSTRLTLLNEFLHRKEFFLAYADKAFLLADTLVAGCPDAGKHCYPYGLMLAAQGRFEEASLQLSRYIGYDKSRYEVWEALLQCEERCGNCADQLFEHAREAAELFPLHLYPYLVLANCYQQRGDCEQCRIYLDRCMMIAPNDETVQQQCQKLKELCQ